MSTKKETNTNVPCADTKMKKIIFGLITVIAILVTGLSINSIICNKQNQASNMKLKVGVVVPLSGNLAFAGNFVKNSMNMLIDSTKVEIIFEDSKGTAKDGINAANKLIQTDSIDILVSMMSFISEAINPICETKNLPHFIFSFSPNLMKSDVVIKHFPSSTQEAIEYVNFIKSNKYKSVSFLRHIEPDATVAYDKIISPELTKFGVALSDHLFDTTKTNDFNNLIVKTKNDNSELVIIQTYSFNYPNIAKNISAYDLKTNVLADLNFVDVITFDDSTIKTLEDISFLGVSYVLGDNYKKYAELYKEKYGIKPYAYGAYAYDLASLLNNIGKQNGHFNKGDFLKKCNNLHLMGVCGAIKYEANGDLICDYEILKIKNGEFIQTKLN